jgi:hypothetical protein
MFELVTHDRERDQSMVCRPMIVHEQRCRLRVGFNPQNLEGVTQLPNRLFDRSRTAVGHGRLACARQRQDTGVGIETERQEEQDDGRGEKSLRVMGAYSHGVSLSPVHPNRQRHLHFAIHNHSSVWFLPVVLQQLDRSSVAPPPRQSI